MNHRPWAVLLAGGEGARLRGLSTDDRGEPAPKQYCAFGTKRTLLARSLDRASRVAPGRVLPVVAESHRPWWKRGLADFREDAIVVQPENRGTAAAILLSLLLVARRDPKATIVVLPTDHSVEDEEAFATSLWRVVFHAERWPDQVILLGITPDLPECEYGWIVPLDPGGREPRSVAHFVEKPNAERATRLMREGALWNSFVFAGRVRALLDMYRRTQADLLDLFLKHFGVSARRAAGWERLFSEIPSRDFSREVLQAAPECLRVLRAIPCGWTDLGTPARLSTWRARRGIALRSSLLPEITMAFGIEPTMNLTTVSRRAADHRAIKPESVRCRGWG